MTIPTADDLARTGHNNPRWKGVKRGYTAEDVVRLRGTVHDRALARAARRREALGVYMHSKPFVNALGALTGNQAVQQVKAGLKAIYCSAGRSPPTRTLAGADVSGPVAVSGELGARSGAQRINNALMRADQIDHAEGRRRHRLAAADRRRCRSRVRRRAQRLRADEGDDRSGRRRRALRRSAARRRSAGTWAARCWCRRRGHAEAHRRAPGGRRHATCRRCSWRAPMPSAANLLTPTSTSATARSSHGERTSEGFFYVKQASSRRSPAAWPMRRMPI